MELSPRLLKIASLVPDGAVVADVGTDHGYIPLYLFEKNIISHAVAMDVNPMPLKRAEDNITSSGYGKMCEFRLSDGLEKLVPDEVDYIVIAGMGGLLIRDILDSGKEIVTKDTTLLLQPMIAAPELRKYLFESGYTIDDEYLIREEDKYYNIIKARKGISSHISEDIYIGRNTRINSPEVFDSYIEYKMRVTAKIIDGMKKSKNPDNGEIARHIFCYNLYEKYKNEV